MTHIETMKQALDALEGVLDAEKGQSAQFWSVSGGVYEAVECNNAIKALRAAIAQPELWAQWNGAIERRKNTLSTELAELRKELEFTKAKAQRACEMWVDRDVIIMRLEEQLKGKTMTTDKFPWGKVTKVHTIGTHHITEYVVGPLFENSGETQFSIEGESYDELDMAILGSLCRKAGESDALPYIVRMLGM